MGWSSSFPPGDSPYIYRSYVETGPEVHSAVDRVLIAAFDESGIEVV
jgi:hypothetical protein